MTASQLAKMILDPAEILRALGIQPDPWQQDFLSGYHPQTLLNICRQGGKSRAVSALALHTALFTPQSTTLIISPGQRQSTEVFHKIVEAYTAIGRPIAATYETQLKLELANGSRILCLPGKEETVRCYSPQLILIDEASRVPDDLYRAIRPMLTISKGRIVALSTPFGQRGWYYHEWKSQNNWHRVQITAAEHPRIGAEILHSELASMGQAWIDQEYLCLFTAMQGLVYPDFQKCQAPIDITKVWGQKVGGIDWGWRNPFAAIWGTLDNDDVLHLYGERYLRQVALHEHAAALPKITWYADPAGRTELEEFRAAGHVIRRAVNTIRLGIAAISARLRDGRLVIDPKRCPNLCAEATLYRYPDDKERIVYGENPIDDQNHALGALRYLISRIDARYLAKLRHKITTDGPIEADQEPEKKKSTQRDPITNYFTALNEHESWTDLN
jgi:hypothetical protein